MSLFKLPEVCKKSSVPWIIKTYLKIFFWKKAWLKCLLDCNSPELNTKSTPFPTFPKQNLACVSLCDATVLLPEFKLNSYIFKKTSHSGIEMCETQTQNTIKQLEPSHTIWTLLLSFNLWSSGTFFELVSSCAVVLWWVSEWIHSFLEDALFSLLCSVFPLRGLGCWSLNAVQYKRVHSLPALPIWDCERQILPTFL